MSEYSELKEAIAKHSRVASVGRLYKGRYRIVIRRGNRQPWFDLDQLKSKISNILPEHMEVVEVRDRMYYIARNWPGGMEYSVYVARKQSE